MAAPHVAGTIALLRQADRGIRARTGGTPRDLGDRGGAGPHQPAGSHLRRGERRRAAGRVAGRRPRAGCRGRSPRARARAQARAPHRGVCRTRPPRRRPRRSATRPGDDRSRATPRLVARRAGLLAIGYRARAADAVAGVADKSLWVRVSEGPNTRGAPAGWHTFTGRGPVHPAGALRRRPAAAAVQRALPGHPGARSASARQPGVHALRRDHRSRRATPARCHRCLERRARAGLPLDRDRGPPLPHGGQGRSGEQGCAPPSWWSRHFLHLDPSGAVHAVELLDVRSGAELPVGPPASPDPSATGARDGAPSVPGSLLCDRPGPHRPAAQGTVRSAIRAV